MKEWRIYIEKDNRFYRVFKIHQLNNGDVTLIPHYSTHINSGFIKGSVIGHKIFLKNTSKDVIIDHYSAHLSTGERHVKFNDHSKLRDVVIGVKNPVIHVLPIGSMVVTTAKCPDLLPKNKNKKPWYGFKLPDDVDHCILDLFAIPKDTAVDLCFEQNINNTKESRETVGAVTIPMRTLDVRVIVRTSNHNQCTLDANVFIHHTEEKTGQIVRVSGSTVELDVSGVNIY